jgi:hypothetical protein
MKQNPVYLRDTSEGIIQKIDSSLLPSNSVYMGVNMLFDSYIGRATLRAGITKLGDDLTGSCKGLYQFILSSGTKKLLSVFDENIYSLETTTWTNRTAMTGDVRFVTYLDTVAAINGTTCKSSANGTTWVTTGGNLDVGNMPNGQYILEWKDKVYVAGVNSNLDRLYFSSLPIDGAISWTDDTAGYIDIEPEEGAGPIVGLAKVPGYLLMFKNRSIKRWNGQSTFPESLINIGTTSQEAIVSGRESVFFWNERGVYETTGGYPRKISRRIQDIIDAVSSSYDVSGWSDKDNIYFSIGDITIDDVDYDNCVIVYNIDTQSWTTFSFPKNFVRLAEYVDDKDELIAGDATGNVWTLFDGTTDDGEDINWMLQYQEQEIDHRSRYKELSKFVVFTEKVNNATLYIRSEDKDFEAMGKINNKVEVITNDIRGRYFTPKISGTGRSGEVIGLEITEVNTNIAQEL